MTWQIYTIASIAIFTLFNLIQRNIALRSTHARANGIIFTAIGGTLTLIIALVTGQLTQQTLPTSIMPWGFLFLSAILYGVYERGRFSAAKYLEASVLQTFITVSIIANLITSTVLYKEPLSLQTLLATLCIFAGLLLISWEHKKSSNHVGIYIALGMGIAQGIAWATDKQATNFFSPEFYSIFIWYIPMLSLLFPVIAPSTILKEWTLNTKEMLLLASLNVFGFLFQMKALAAGPATVVMPLIQTSVLTTVFTAYIFLNERSHLGKKLIAASLTLLGVILMM